MSRHPIERLSEQAATGFFTTDVGMALGRIESGDPLALEDQGAVREAQRLLTSMRDTEPRLDIGRSDNTLMLDLFEVVGEGRSVEEQEIYLGQLAKAADQASAESPKWSPDLETLQQFFSRVSEHQLAKMNAERGGCF